MNNRPALHLTAIFAVFVATLPVAAQKDYFRDVDPAVAAKVSAMVANWKSITPEIMQQPENQAAIPILKEMALEDDGGPAITLMLNFGDPDVIARLMRGFHGQQPIGAWLALERCSQPKIIPLLADDLNRNESSKITYVWIGIDEREGRVPLSVYAGGIMRAIMQNSPRFTPEVKAWVASLEPVRHTRRDEVRQAMRTWWAENAELIKAEKYDLVKPGPSVEDTRATALSCLDATAPYGGIVTLSATLTDSSLPNHPVITGKTLGFAISGKSVSNPYEAWLAPGTHPVTVSFAGDSSYGPSSATCQLTVQSSPGKITGGGSIGPGQRSFGFVAQTKTKGSDISYTGNCTFQDAAQNIDLKAVEITGMAVAGDRVHGTFVATATNIGTPGYTMTVYLEDRGEPGTGADKFHLQVSGPNGFAYDSAPEDQENKILVGGNIQIHKPH